MKTAGEPESEIDSGHEPDFRLVLPTPNARPGRHPQPIRFCAYNLDGAYEAWLALPAGPSRSPLIFYCPEMGAFRADSRFMPLAEVLALADYWLKSGQWPDFGAAPDRPYDCRAAARQARAT
ncbi:MAG TPA: hypothetical protein VFH92_00885 [Phenylobacterium sp.]|nr:hypothetical protein [Phenylobacterium sp.]